MCFVCAKTTCCGIMGIMCWTFFWPDAITTFYRCVFYNTVENAVGAAGDNLFLYCSWPLRKIALTLPHHIQHSTLNSTML